MVLLWVLHALENEAEEITITLAKISSCGNPTNTEASLCAPRTSGLTPVKALMSLNCHFLFTAGLSQRSSGVDGRVCALLVAPSLARTHSPKLLFVQRVNESSRISGLNVGNLRFRWKRFKITARGGYLGRHFSSISEGLLNVSV